MAPFIVWNSPGGDQRTNSDASPSPASVEIVRRLLARDGLTGSDVDPATAAAALQRTCLRVSGTLREVMGEDGCTALLARALGRTEHAYPLLKSVRRLNGHRIVLDGVVTSVEEHGVVAVTSAIEAVLAALVDILGRLIGEDMAIRLVDGEASPSRLRGGAHPS